MNRRGVGVLALQGSFREHVETFAGLGVAAREVRQRRDLDGVTHLVIPGGESTAIRRLLDRFEIGGEIVRRHARGELALLGTCAGAILLGRDDGEPPPRLGLLDATLRRNAYGRQVDSFSRTAPLDLLGRPFHCVFIRAPRIVEVGSGVRVLGALDGEPVIVEGPGVLATTFHPELAGDPAIHDRFLRLTGRPRPRSSRSSPAIPECRSRSSRTT